ncbi:MAG: hypothetical protein IPK74_00240 [Deltaproteobacteria bacterium]|nr:hypothetical protein [Deltaproteobacteria bacterium]
MTEPPQTPEPPRLPELDAWRVAPLSDDFADQVLARMNDDDVSLDPVPPPSPPRPRRAPVIVLAGIAAAAAVLAVLWWRSPSPSPSSEPSAAPPPPAALEVAGEIEAAPAAGLSREAIGRTLREDFMPFAEMCHGALIINAVQYSGQLVLELTVVRRDGRGVVTVAEFSRDSELEDPGFRDCLRSRALDLVFDAPADDAPVEIEVPLDFRDPWTR